MNRQETTQIITLLGGNYQRIAEKTISQKQMMINTWYECLKDLDYKVVLQAIKETMIQSSYPPTIHDVRQNATRILNPIPQRSGIEAWREAYSMICNGIYITQEEFEQASPEVQKFFGDVRQVKELAQTDIDTVNTVTKGQFLKQYEIMLNRATQEKLLPSYMRELEEHFDANK